MDWNWNYISEPLFCGRCDYQVENEYAWCRRCGEHGRNDDGVPNDRDGGRLDLPFYGVTGFEYDQLSRRAQKNHDHYCRRRLDSRYGRIFWYLPPRPPRSSRDEGNAHRQNATAQRSLRRSDSRERRYSQERSEDQGVAQQHHPGSSRTNSMLMSQSRERRGTRQPQLSSVASNEQVSDEENESIVPVEGAVSQHEDQTSTVNRTEIDPEPRIPGVPGIEEDPGHGLHASSRGLGSPRVKVWHGTTCWCGQSHPEKLHDTFDQFLEIVYYVVPDRELDEAEACRNCAKPSRAKSHTTDQCGRKCYYDHPKNPKVSEELRPFIRSWPNRSYCRFRPFPQYYYFPERFPYPGAPLPRLPETSLAGISAGLIDLENGSAAMAISLALKDE